MDNFSKIFLPNVEIRIKFLQYLIRVRPEKNKLKREHFETDYFRPGSNRENPSLTFIESIELY